MNADTLDGADLCRTDGVLRLPGGTVADPPNTQQLCAEGPLSIEAYCDRGFDHGNDFVDAAIRIDTSTSGWFLATTTASFPEFYDTDGFKALTGASIGPPENRLDPVSDVDFEAFWSRSTAVSCLEPWSLTSTGTLIHVRSFSTSPTNRTRTA